MANFPCYRFHYSCFAIGQAGRPFYLNILPSSCTIPSQVRHPHVALPTYGPRSNSQRRMRSFPLLLAVAAIAAAAPRNSGDAGNLSSRGDGKRNLCQCYLSWWVPITRDPKGRLWGKSDIISFGEGDRNCDISCQDAHQDDDVSDLLDPYWSGHFVDKFGNDLE